MTIQMEDRLNKYLKELNDCKIKHEKSLEGKIRDEDYKWYIKGKIEAFEEVLRGFDHSIK